MRSFNQSNLNKINSEIKTVIWKIEPNEDKKETIHFTSEISQQIFFISFSALRIMIKNIVH